MDVEKYAQRLVVLERELVRKLEREVEAARTTAGDQPEPGDQSLADELRETYFTLAQSDSQLLANVRGALRRIEDGTYRRCVVDGSRRGIGTLLLITGDQKGELLRVTLV